MPSKVSKSLSRQDSYELPPTVEEVLGKLRIATANEYADHPVPAIDRLKFIMSNQDHDHKYYEQADSTCRAKIQRVPIIVREVPEYKELYEPLMVSIGPYHYWRSQKLHAMQKYKEEMMRKYVASLGGESVQVVEEVYTRVLGEIDRVKELFYVMDTSPTTDHQESYLSNDELYRYIMFVDGCFLVEFILNYLEDQDNNMMIKYASHWIVRDLFLLENQLPFSLIKLLMGLKGFEVDKIIDFVDRINSTHPPLTQRSVFTAKKTQKEGSSNNVAVAEWKEMVSPDLPIHLLQLLQMMIVCPSHEKKLIEEAKGKQHDDDDGDGDDHDGVQDLCWYQRHSATELKSAGIVLKSAGNSDQHPPPHRLTDTYFEEGTLTVCPITIDTLTKTMLMNLVGFEALLPEDRFRGVTSYLCLLDSLIDRVEDVKELRSKGIILNSMLESDEHIADIFKSLTRGLVPNPEAFAEVWKGINRHYHQANQMKKTMNSNCTMNERVSPLIAFILLGLTIALVRALC